MKKCLMLIAAAMVAAGVARGDTEVVDGMTWTYSLNGGEATVGTGNWSIPAITNSTTGEISIPNKLGNCHVTKIGGGTFYGCSNLTAVKIPDSVTDMEGCIFYGCTSLQSIKIPNGVKDVGSQSFYRCTGLKSLQLPSGITNINHEAFKYCRALKSVMIPDSVEHIGLYAFQQSGLQAISLPLNLKQVEIAAFANCSSLTNVELSGAEAKIGELAFSECQNLSSVVIYDGVSIVCSRAFKNCSSLENLEIWGNTTFGTDAFYGCNNIRTVILRGTPPLSPLKSILTRYNVNVYYTRECAGYWRENLGVDRFRGFYLQPSNNVQIISTSIRSDDPSVLDVVYKVKSDKPTVKVRAVAYIDGVRSFSNIVRMENLVDGTKASVSDTVTANEEHTISWKASEDLNVDLAKVKVEVLAVETQLLPLEVIRIPAIGDKKAMELSWNVHTKDQLFDALLWLYADKTSGLTLTNGILYGDGKPLLAGADFYTTVTKQDAYYPEYTYQESVYHTDDAIGFIFKQMGYSVLTGDALTYANKMTRLGLTVPDTYYGEKNYAYRWLEK